MNRHQFRQFFELPMLRKNEFSYDVVRIVQDDGFRLVGQSKLLAGNVGGTIFGTVDFERLIIGGENLLVEGKGADFFLLLVLLGKFQHSVASQIAIEDQIFSRTQIDDDAVFHFDSCIVKNVVQSLQHQTVMLARNQLSAGMVVDERDAFGLHFEYISRQQAQIHDSGSNSTCWKMLNEVTIVLEFVECKGVFHRLVFECTEKPSHIAHIGNLGSRHEWKTFIFWKLPLYERKISGISLIVLFP